MSLFPDIDASAVLSEDRVYRYSLSRVWGDPELPRCVFIGLNPSTADETQDDPTIRRCIGFARRLGFDGLTMLNLFAFRATKPEDMMTAADAVGPDNDQTLHSTALEAGLIIACWGAAGGFRNRDREVSRLLGAEGLVMKCFGTTVIGHPRHPLYLPAHAELIDYGF